ncbi:MBL fold metallo-hydrolase RNA specificity domain-containing protein [Stutzerimonas kunmingensis]|jgi:metallo-beta-lactamase family protein|uniref:MBL fold metallo-hydrolase RNA specificity domain-containing protein n=1 Tax=Stutzerimonas kunmingensis TaxID=1211807 RepID=UPI0028A690DB|nr:MBL fold metallo-hydrolase RNA specificity domain-containing protein [Stutzerimonas kunmingensis]
MNHPLLFGGYPAHADQNGLLEFVTSMREWPTDIWVVHGEQKAKEALAEPIKARYLGGNKNVELRL